MRGLNLHSLEPGLEKYPVLALFRNFSAECALAALMSGSGSTTFAIADTKAAADMVENSIEFGKSCMDRGCGDLMGGAP